MKASYIIENLTNSLSTKLNLIKRVGNQASIVAQSGIKSSNTNILHISLTSN